MKKHEQLEPIETIDGPDVDFIIGAGPESPVPQSTQPGAKMSTKRYVVTLSVSLPEDTFEEAAVITKIKSIVDGLNNHATELELDYSIDKRPIGKRQRKSKISVEDWVSD